MNMHKSKRGKAILKVEERKRLHLLSSPCAPKLNGLACFGGRRVVLAQARAARRRGGWICHYLREVPLQGGGTARTVRQVFLKPANQCNLSTPSCKVVAHAPLTPTLHNRFEVLSTCRESDEVAPQTIDNVGVASQPVEAPDQGPATGDVPPTTESIGHDPGESTGHEASGTYASEFSPSVASLLAEAVSDTLDRSTRYETSGGERYDANAPGPSRPSGPIPPRGGGISTHVGPPPRGPTVPERLFPATRVKPLLEPRARLKHEGSPHWNKVEFCPYTPDGTRPDGSYHTPRIHPYPANLHVPQYCDVWSELRARADKHQLDFEYYCFLVRKSFGKARDERSFSELKSKSETWWQSNRPKVADGYSTAQIIRGMVALQEYSVLEELFFQTLRSEGRFTIDGRLTMTHSLHAYAKTGRIPTRGFLARFFARARAMPRA